MSKNKNFYSKIAVQKPIWDLLGTDIRECGTQESALHISDLGYEVVLENLQARGKDVDGYFAIMRSDMNDTFGIVTEKYKIIQNYEAFVSFDRFVEDSGSKYHYAGMLDNGKISWMLARCPEFDITFHLNGTREIISMYAMMMNKFDGLHSMKVLFIPFREKSNVPILSASPVCESSFSIKHDSNYKQNIYQAEYIIEKLDQYRTFVASSIDKMKNQRKLTDENKYKLFRRIVEDNQVQKKLSVRSSNKIDAMLNYCNYHPTQEGITDNGFGCYCAVVGYYHNIKDYDSSRKQDHDGVEKKFNNFFIKGDASKDAYLAFHYSTVTNLNQY